MSTRKKFTTGSIITLLVIGITFSFVVLQDLVCRELYGFNPDYNMSWLYEFIGVSSTIDGIRWRETGELSANEITICAVKVKEAWNDYPELKGNRIRVAGVRTVNNQRIAYLYDIDEKIAFQVGLVKENYIGKIKGGYDAKSISIRSH